MDHGDVNDRQRYLHDGFRGADKNQGQNQELLYARAVHTNHMIQHHMHEISERQCMVDEYQSMVDGGRELIPLELDQYKNDPVINQHIMQMIDTNIFFSVERPSGQF